MLQALLLAVFVFVQPYIVRTRQHIDVSPGTPWRSLLRFRAQPSGLASLGSPLLAGRRLRHGGRKHLQDKRRRSRKRPVRLVAPRAALQAGYIQLRSARRLLHAGERGLRVTLRLPNLEEATLKVTSKLS